MLKNEKNIENIIKDNMMDYSAYVNLNRAIPDIRDGFKPIYRRILFTMNRMNATKFTKSANVSGEVMKVSPHGDCYDTIVNMVQPDRQLTPPLIGKGNFSNYTSRDLQYGASRYTEVKLNKLSIDTLKNLNKSIVKYIPNYDGTIMMPEVLPVKFPMILHLAQEGIGVGMASKIPSFNMNELTEAIELYIKNGVQTDLIPDFATGGEIINNKKIISKINNNGVGTLMLRGKCVIDDNIIKITEIPYSTTREAIIDKIIQLIKEGKLKEISSVKDLTGLNGMCIEVTCKKHTNMQQILNKLYNFTPLQSAYNSNINVLCDGLPKTMGVWDIIDNWLQWRSDCVVKAYSQDIQDLKNKLHLYEGLLKIFDSIDDAIEMIKNGTSDNVIIENLCDKFQIDKIQAEYILNIKLRNLNKVYIKKYISDDKELKEKIEQYSSIINDKTKILKTIIQDVKDVAKKYGQDRKTTVIEENQTVNKEELIEDYNCRIIYTKNYIKKHLKQSDNHKVKEGEIIIDDIATNNKSTLLVFTNKANRYKIPVYELEDLTPSAYGQFIPSLIQLEEGEEVIKIVSVDDSSKGYIVSIFENGKVAKVNIKSFMSNNKKLMNCFNAESKLININYIEKEKDIFMLSSEGKGLVFNTERINSKSSRNTQGNIGIKLNEGFKVVAAIIGATKDDRFTIHTEKGKEIRVLLDDISPKDDTMWFDYVYGKCGNMGNFIYNTRSKNDLITNVEVN